MTSPIKDNPRGKQGHYGPTPSRRYKPDDPNADNPKPNQTVSGLEYILLGMMLFFTEIAVTITPNGEKYINELYTEVKNA